MNFIFFVFDFFSSKEEYLLKNAQREETKVHGQMPVEKEHRNSVKEQKSTFINKV